MLPAGCHQLQEDLPDLHSYAKLFSLTTSAGNKRKFDQKSSEESHEKCAGNNFTDAHIGVLLRALK
jgi:hypothetical protein